MNNITLVNLIKEWRLIVTSVIVCALIAFIISAILPAKYQSDIQMIVVQKQADDKVDAFSATKSAEFLSNIFAQAIYTTSFFNAVQDAPFEVRRDFSHDPEQREKEWNKFINVKKVNNTGILKISIYDESRKTVEETANAVAYVLTTNSEEYHGGADRVEVRLIDGPNTPLRPTVPRVLPNTIGGALFGILIAIVIMVFFPHIRFERSVRNDRNKTYDQMVVNTSLYKEKPVETVENETIVDEHFRSVAGTIEFDPEVDELHKRIGIFHQNTK